jgi:hypothetical protein
LYGFSVIQFLLHELMNPGIHQFGFAGFNFPGIPEYEWQRPHQPEMRNGNQNIVSTGFSGKSPGPDPASSRRRLKVSEIHPGNREQSLEDDVWPVQPNSQIVPGEFHRTDSFPTSRVLLWPQS